MQRHHKPAWNRWSAAELGMGIRPGLAGVAAGAILAPVLLGQGLYVRRVTPRLPEPAGSRCGRVGSGPLLKLLIIGDSAAAGVGVNDQRQALAGRLAVALSNHFELHWRLIARTGVTTRDALATVQASAPESFDVVVTSLGVNDVISRLNLSSWRHEQRRLREQLRSRFGIRQLIVTGLPPMGWFPALPQPLRWYLGQRAGWLDRMLREDLAQEPDAEFLSVAFGPEKTLMASDGFHPGAAAYRQWAEAVAELIVARHGTAAA